ncbi:MAG: DNA translocase FtsK 4TM domain-containing protein [Candidatus Vogelbacteria bacterium]|nr:DNA translocase FtsK 4TM domain-containing protein [Candidatus Vogelbacteria bacterium]
MKKRNSNKESVRNDESQDRVSGIFSNLSAGTRHGILAILSVIIAIFLVMAYFEAAGPAGKFVYGFLYTLFGSGYLLFPTAFILASFSFLIPDRDNILTVNIVSGGFFLISTLGVIDIVFNNATSGDITGGLIGHITSLPFLKLFDKTLSIIFLIAISVISILIMFETHLSLEWRFLGKKIFGSNDSEEEQEVEKTEKENQKIAAAEASLKQPETPQKDAASETHKDDKPKKTVAEKIESFFDNNLHLRSGKQFDPPPLSLLERDIGKPIVGDIKANANIIKRTLQNFGIDVEMDEIAIGPSITRYSLKPAEGVKLSRIVALQNDLALALAAHPIRIEAPIPGKSLVGIEIPNSVKSTVGLGTLLASKKFQESDRQLLVPLGKGVSGIPYFSDIAKAPHMLIAGATGSGKSVTIHTIITALLYRNAPEHLRFIMIDPKRVELTLYNGIPHLLTPVITEPKRAILSLKWAAKEMERRYNILEQCKVRDIASYHHTIAEKQAANKDDISTPLADRQAAGESMPYIVVLIDELADIMSAYPRELEAAIVRLAQMSRAVGIHLVLSTQRPSVEIITGLIKANIPSRIALQVPSQIDSRTILDMPGAEKLLGAGDMLYISGDTSKPIRIQSGYISENEVKKVVSHLINKYKEELPDEISLGEQNGTSEDLQFSESIDDNSMDGSDDDMYDEARELVVKTGKASASYLQRKLKLGYARAARIMDMLEDRGVIGPADGAKPRDVYEKDSSVVLEKEADKLLMGAENETENVEATEDLN